jgi:elongation factor Ts
LNAAIEKNPANIEELLALQVNNLKLADAIIEKIGTIGEKLEVSYYEKIEAAKVFSYIHPGNKLATLVGFNKPVAEAQMGKDVAMQIAAMSPVSVDKDDCPTDVIQKEIEIGKEQARQEGKPEAMLEKIAMGKLQKFYAESTLLNQEFVKDNTMNIRQYIQSADKELTVTAFRRFSLNA